MAARKRKKAKSGILTGAGRWLLLAAVFAAGLAGGYCWRSYAPLPMPEGSPLTGGSPGSSAPASAEMSADLRASNSRLEKAQKEARELRERLQELEQVQERAEEDLADIQIKSILVNN